MGAASSTNVTKLVTDTVTEIVGKIVNESIATSSNSIYISATDVDGDVIIDNNVFSQKATLSFNAFFQAMNSAEVQEKIQAQVSQAAKSLLSGLNLGQIAITKNQTDHAYTSVTRISQQVDNKCIGSSSNAEKIVINKVGGNFKLTNNQFLQVNSVVFDCIANAVNKSKAIKEVAIKISQTASSTAEGISIWGFFIPIAIAVVALGYFAMKYIYPILMAAGVVMVGMYFLNKVTHDKRENTRRMELEKQRFESRYYFTFEKQCPGNHVVLKSFDTKNTLNKLMTDAWADPNIVAFDHVFRNAYSPNTARVTHYTTLDCADVDGVMRGEGPSDNVDVLTYGLSFSSSETDPNTIPSGNEMLEQTQMYVCRTSGEIWDRDGYNFYKRALPEADTTGLLYAITTIPPSKARADRATRVYRYSQNEPEKMYLYGYDSNKKAFDVLGDEFKGPGKVYGGHARKNSCHLRLVFEPTSPDQSTAFLLYAGIALIVVGLVGTLADLVKSRGDKSNGGAATSTPGGGFFDKLFGKNAK